MPNDNINENKEAIEDLQEHRIEELNSLEEDKNVKLPTGFYFDEDRLMYQESPKLNQEGESIPIPPIFICSRLEIFARTRDSNNENHGRLLEFKDDDNILHQWPMPMQLLAGDGTRYREVLLDMGLSIAPGSKARQLLTTYIQVSKPKSRVRCVTQTGWHKNSFVLPDATIGTAFEEKTILQTGHPTLPNYSTSGSLQDWQENVSNFCVGNSRLILSLCTAFAPPLLHLIGIENGGLHLRGSSSIGKTTSLRVAASVWGGEDYIQRWRATDNGLEAVAAGHNDTLLCLDEISQSDPNMVGETAYMLANGSGKIRGAKDGRLQRKKSSWRLLFLSTGEKSLSSHMAESGKKSKAGQEVRLLEIPADTNKYGLFEHLHEYDNGAEFSDVIKDRTLKYYGVAGREFVRNIIENKASIDSAVKKFVNKFISEHVPKNSDGQVMRAAGRFALIAAAGELATQFGITGWEPSCAAEGVAVCFNAWLSDRGGIGSSEETKIESQVRLYFAQHGESRFTPWFTNSSDSRTTHNRAGFRKETSNGTEFFVYPVVFKTEIAKGFDPKLVAEICVKRGLLMLSSDDKYTRSEALPGSVSNSRCYRFASKVLGEDDES